MNRLIALLIGTLFYVNSFNLKAQTEVTFYTTEGDFVIMLYDSLMPITAGNFRNLVDSNFYDGVIFHRVISNFMIQGGDPTGTGFGGPGYTIPDEFDSTLSNTQRTISMANSGPNTGGSQFFINLVNNSYLDFDKAPLTSQHPVFGIVINNWSIVQKIGSVAVSSSDKPITDVIMDSVRVTPANIGLREHLLVAKGHIYPNPASKSSRLFVQFKGEGSADLSVYSLSGQLIYEEKVNLREGNNGIALKTIFEQELTSGVYNILVRMENEFVWVKMVVN